jgi:cyclophilin family peptidyl-prolyl cis-trans isomerase
MLDRERGKGFRGLRFQQARKLTRRGHTPTLDGLERRDLLAALAPIGTVNAPAFVGYQLPLDGSAAGAAQTFTVTSSNPNIPVTVTSGEFLTLNITHNASSTPGDISFTGPITFQLFGDLTPNTVKEIESFVTSGFYNGKVFHRVANGFPGPKDFIVQGGSASGNGSGNSGLPGTPFPDEFNQQLAFTSTYQVAMANAGPNTNDTQFFITTGTPTALSFAYTIFGQVVSGTGIVDDMTRVAVGGSNGTTPVSPITIVSATLSASNPNGVLHIDETHATPGQSTTVTVTAHEPGNNTSVSRQFQVNVVANPQSERPFVNLLANQSVGSGQTFQFQIPAVSATPGVQLGYTIQGGFNATTGAFTPIQNATATVDQNTGIVKVTPDAGFTGNITLLYGVRDASFPDSPTSYQYHTMTLTVNSSTTPVPLIPIAVSSTKQINLNTPTPIHLSAVNTNPGTNPTFTYSITSSPLFGTISNFNQNTGTFTYTPPANFSGADTMQYTVTATGGGQAPSTSIPSYVFFNVAPPTGNTHSVIVIGNTMLITPPPRTDKGTNVIDVGETTDSSGNPIVQVTVNGLRDTQQPQATAISRIVVFGGSRVNNQITVDPDVTVPNITLDGGHGIRNVLQAGSTVTRMHGWFGQTTLIGGTGPNQMVGRAGHVKFKPTDTTNEIFAGRPRLRTMNGSPRPPGGTFFRFVNGRIVPIPTPRPIR